tara:strand:+ start:728 stop:973 length:246 start_codon:yes stop_codon:yes gene_type:complete
LVNSLQITIFLPEKKIFNFSIILLIFFDEIKKTILDSRFDNKLKTFSISFKVEGKKPQKKYLSLNPETETAVVTADGPGIG